MTGDPYTLLALDGADDDGGTLYVLLDEGLPVRCASWPMPLERYAADRGRPVVSVNRGADYGPDDADDERELLDELMAAVHAAKDA